MTETTESIKRDRDSWKKIAQRETAYRVVLEKRLSSFGHDNCKHLLKPDGTVAGLYDVAQWWIDTYPEDIFIGLSDGACLVAEIRDKMKEILKMRK